MGPPENPPTSARLAEPFPCDLLHVWHGGDAGFRLAAIPQPQRSSTGQGEYLVSMDGDCSIPFPDFAREHLRLAQAGYRRRQPGAAVGSSRRNCWRKVIGQRRHSGVPCAGWPPGGRSRRIVPCLAETGAQRLMRCQALAQVLSRGPYIGVWRSDYSSSTASTKPSPELGTRGLGLRRPHDTGRAQARRTGRFAVPVLHLWHKENDRQNQPENWARLEATLQGTAIRALQAWINTPSSVGPRLAPPPIGLEQDGVAIPERPVLDIPGVSR